jgi:hypothetical protein
MTSTATLSVSKTVERAGFCADGDYCPRFHCQTCGRYWLGDENKHTCGVAVPDLEQRIYAWMAEELAADRDLAACERNVLARIRAEGLGDALLDTYGPQLIDELWRDRDHDNDIPQTRDRQPHTAKPGVRRVDVAQLASQHAILECIFVVAGHWVRLGDLTKPQCQTLQRQHAATASAFGKLAASLAADQIVRDRWTAAQLEALAGDTFRGAALARPTW